MIAFAMQTSGIQGDRGGFTFIELMITLAILAVIMSLALPLFDRALNDARCTRAIGDIKALEKEILLYELRSGTPLLSLSDIGKSDLLDPWGHPYQYVSFSTLPRNAQGDITGGVRKDKNLHPLNSSYDLYSVGEDGDTMLPLTASVSRDDIVRAGDGSFVGLAENF